MRWLEFGVALVAVALIVVAAFIERGGQPTINIIIPEPTIITPSIPSTAEAPKTEGAP
tara:strand:+ start:394 stop:567 length:174 start_codon:yes stop_codon:yes gene_type:complete